MTEKKRFYNEEIDRVLKLVSFNSDNVEILGSYATTNKYFGDVDMFEARLKNYNITDRFKDKIKKIMKNEEYYITDIKCGVNQNLRVINENAFIDKGKLYLYNSAESKKKLKGLKKYFTVKEYSFLNKLLVTNPNEKQLQKIKNNLRLHIIRWSPEDILNGYTKMLNGKKIEFENALKTDGLFKLDFIKYCYDNDFLEFSIIYDLRDKKGFKLNNNHFNTVDSLKRDIKKYEINGNYFKMLKRKLSLLRYEFSFLRKKENKEKIIVLTGILNDKLGNLYQIKNSLENLLFLIKHFKNLEKDRVNKSLNHIIDKMTYLKGDYKDEANHLKKIIVNKSVNADVLENLYKKVDRELNLKSKKYI